MVVGWSELDLEPKNLLFAVASALESVLEEFQFLLEIFRTSDSFGPVNQVQGTACLFARWW
jgi:hypothetical protein